VASFGFDEKFFLRALVDHRPSRAYALALRVEESSWSRVVVAFERAKPIASIMGVDARLVSVSPGSGLGELVYSVKNTVREIVGGCRGVVVSLTGGPRVLVVSLLLALLGLEDELAGRVRLRVEGEGFERVYLEELTGLRPVQLNGDLRSVLQVVVRETLQGRGVGPSGVARELNMPKSTAHKRLQELARLGLIAGSQGVYRATLLGIVNA
jgi:CRISPR-associated protein Csa3